MGNSWRKYTGERGEYYPTPAKSYRRLAAAADDSPLTPRIPEGPRHEETRSQEGIFRLTSSNNMDSSLRKYTDVREKYPTPNKSYRRPAAAADGSPLTPRIREGPFREETLKHIRQGLKRMEAKKRSPCTIEQSQQQGGSSPPPQKQGKPTLPTQVQGDSMQPLLHQASN